MNLNAARSWVVQELADALQDAVKAMTSVRPEISWQSLDGTASGGAPQKESIWWAQAFSGLPSPSVWVGAPVATVTAIGQSVLSALGMADVSAEEARSVCQDLLAQTANALAISMSELLTKPVTSNGVTPTGAPQGTLAAALVVELPAVPDTAVLTVRCDQGFLGRLAEVLAPSSPPEASPAERIADLELSVYAILGRTSIPLRDVFKLMVGSVIDLGKTITDPVDVVVNDRVIARGQVVICKGSYGVKMTQQLTGTGGDSCRSTN